MATLTVRETRILKFNDGTLVKIPVCNVDREPDSNGKIASINIDIGFALLYSTPHYQSDYQTLYDIGNYNNTITAGAYSFTFMRNSNTARQYFYTTRNLIPSDAPNYGIDFNSFYHNCEITEIPMFVITPSNKIYFRTLYADFVYIGSGIAQQNCELIVNQYPTTGIFGEIIVNLTRGLTNVSLLGKFTEAESTAIYNNTTPIPTDPYSGAGDSTTGGGDGTFDGSSDPVPVPSLPSIGATDTNFISLFVPSSAQLKQVANYLWGSLFDVSTFKKLFEDPMDCILGLSVVPVSVPTSGNAQITVGNVELSGITLPLASQQYVELDCGTITFDRYFGSYLDFEPYTKMSLFVPYSGVHSVSADDIMGKTVGLKYHIDILTGSLVAFLTCGDSVLYEFNGACASNIPVNSMNYASTIENAIRIAVNIGTTVATAGAAAPATGAVEAGKVAAGGAGIGRGIAIAGSTAEGALSLKPSIDRAGSLGGTTGLMGNQIPYFIITRPRMCKPKNQDFFQGYPSFIQTVLGDMEGTGFTAFENVIIADTYLTETEKAELSSILSAGVYL